MRMVAWFAFVGVLVVCAGMTMVIAAYICMLWYANLRVQPSTSAAASTSNSINNNNVTLSDQDQDEKRRARKGLSAEQLEKIPEMIDDGSCAENGTECAVCLDDIEMGQKTRVLSECKHAFHRNCADAWLLNNAVCPLCRAAPLSAS